MYIVQAEGKFVTRVSPKDVLVKDRKLALLMPYHTAHATRGRLQSAGKRRVVVIEAQPVTATAQDAAEVEGNQGLTI